MSDELTPITRKETFLAKAGGQSVETPTPITREETFLQAIIDNGGGGGGTGGGVLIVHESDDVLDKTWKEIHDATLTSVVVLVRGDEFETMLDYCTSIGINDPDYYVTFDNRYYIASSENGYPVLDMG